MSENFYDEEQEPGLAELLGITPTEPANQADLPTAVIRIQSSAGGVIDVPVEADHRVDGLPGYTLAEVLEAANVTASPSTQYWLGETQINLDTVVAPGATITGIGLMKGG